MISKAVMERRECRRLVRAEVLWRSRWKKDSRLGGVGVGVGVGVTVLGEEVEMEAALSEEEEDG